MRKRHRLSGPAVVIGYILLVPSLLAIAGDLVLILVVAAATAPISASHTGAAADKAVAGGMGVCFLSCMGVSFFISGPLGWLLVMKKRVLQCSNCGGLVAAS
jgi:predicted phage tail protein